MLRAREAELRAAGIVSLFLMGSTSRNEAGPTSDVDLAFDVAPDAPFTLRSQARLQLRLGDLLGVPVDLLERDLLRPEIARVASADMRRVF